MKMKMYAAFGWLFIPLLIMAEPSRVIDLSVGSTNGGTVLRWTAPNPSGVTTLANIDVRYGTSPINTPNWSSKTRVVWLTDPGTPGTVQTAVVTGLTPNTTYYFAIRVQDSAGSWSIISNLSHVLTGDSTYTCTLAWDASPQPGITNYNIYYGPASGVYTDFVSVGNVTSGTVTGRTWGVTYYYAATYVVTGGSESPFSNEVSDRRP